MTFIRGSVAVIAWGVMLVTGLSAAVVLLSGEVVTAAVLALVAWGAWKAIEATAT